MSYRGNTHSGNNMVRFAANFKTAKDAVVSLFTTPYRFLFVSYLVIIFLLFLYSFTQVDLSLVFSRSALLRSLIKDFQYIGYFNRSLSGWLYGGILLLLFGYYIIFLRLAKQHKISKKQLWGILLITIPLLVIAYNAFSYDLFNYIFDAKIVTFYHQNPYMHMAIDFPGDPMLSFMHWTGRVYPYGPVWLGITVPLSFVGFQFFIPTFYLFKILMAVSFLGTVYYIGKIVRLLKPESEVLSMIFFALNPLVLIEALVSAHNDIVMMFLSTVALYYLMKRKYVRSCIFLILSIGLKFATALVSPFYVLLFYCIWRKKPSSLENIIVLMIAAMSVAVLFASLRTTFQPWYLLYILPFMALLAYRFYIIIPGVILSLFALMIYLPFLSSGNWDWPTPMLLMWIEISGIIAALVVSLLYAILKPMVKDLRPSHKVKRCLVWISGT